MNEFFQMLKKDHVELKGILGQLVEAKEPKKREELFQKLREELVPHMKAEESTFYPPLMKKKEAREDVMEGVEEHHVSDLVLKELEKMPKGEEKWGAKMGVFKELVEHHIKDEESKVFKSAEKALDPDEFQAIMAKFDQEKQKIKKTLK
ncbi:MAG: hemerythrin domain-containing protein [Desulfomicrobium sp.]|nr:hemerythrin domain-containing protein [Pseudomonadota bacterium]MBV1713248.1 hemerythrin domain-containing protein [Desulfomicrobium sp.]MBU4571352.1 hemerythrin domain-containing protein [Pseudomonadota bacterium]MBU4595614.1 hemerythrin domain-containing protein [Pseudomonadota bacterium]MBV1720056.1 hemerythrin domain-containing protein [Desulfomicrobium sp.]